jgi:hypothetical protein
LRWNILGETGPKLSSLFPARSRSPHSVLACLPCCALPCWPVALLSRKVAFMPAAMVLPPNGSPSCEESNSADLVASDGRTCSRTCSCSYWNIGAHGQTTVGRLRTGIRRAMREWDMWTMWSLTCDTGSRTPPEGGSSRWAYGILHTCSLNISLLTWITGLFVCSHRYGPSGVRSVQVEYNSRSSRHLDVTIERLLLVCRVLYQITYYSHLDPLHQHLIRPATG